MNYKLRNIFSTDPLYALDEILTDRGVEDLESFKYPTADCELSPYQLDNIREGVKLLNKHLVAKNRIGIIVDADVDGFTSAAMIWQYIKDLDENANLNFYVQNGKKHGLEHLVEELVNNNHYDLVICPDSSTNDIDYMKQLQEIETEVLVIDHHEKTCPGYDDIPSNTVLINNQCSVHYTNKTLCGAGMVYKFCEALDEYFSVEYAKKYVDLAALGEIADVMNRTNCETNYLIINGLKHIQNGLFIELLKNQSYSLKDRAEPPFTGLTATDVSFYIAPMINAVVRMGSLTDNEEMFLAFINPYVELPSIKRGAKEGETENAATRLFRIATRCKSAQNKIKEEALECIETEIEAKGMDADKVLVISVDDIKETEIPPAMRGLIASNLVSIHNRPVLIGSVSSSGMFRGSIRGNDNFAALPNLKEFLDSTGMFDELAGHANAAGFAMKEKDIEKFVDYCNLHFDDDAFDSCHVVDYVLDAEDWKIERLLYELASHPQYFGNGIDEIKVAVTGIPLTSVRIMGANNDSIKISTSNVDYLKFKDLAFIEDIEIEPTSSLNIIGRLSLNTFNGRTSVQVFIDDYELVKPKVAKSKFDF